MARAESQRSLRETNPIAAGTLKTAKNRRKTGIAAIKGLEPPISGMTRMKDPSTPRRQGPARQAATKEFEQEQTEKTEAEKFCQKCPTFGYCTQEGKDSLRYAEPV